MVHDSIANRGILLLANRLIELLNIANASSIDVLNSHADSSIDFIAVTNRVPLDKQVIEGTGEGSLIDRVRISRYADAIDSEVR